MRTMALSASNCSTRTRARPSVDPRPIGARSIEVGRLSMGKVLVHASMSLDGFMAGPNVSVEHPMGEGGLRLHEWLFAASSNEVDARMERETSTDTGAVILGRRTFDVGIGVWEDTPFPVPCFVLTNRPLKPRVEKSGTFTFVGDPETAYRLATQAAGDMDVRLMGARVSQVMLKAGRVDEIVVQLVPVLLGAGRPLFEDLGNDHIELEQVSVARSARVAHLRYRVVR